MTMLKSYKKYTYDIFLLFRKKYSKYKSFTNFEKKRYIFTFLYENDAITAQYVTNHYFFEKIYIYCY